jgi:hypothetical protein
MRLPLFACNGHNTHKMLVFNLFSIIFGNHIIFIINKLQDFLPTKKSVFFTLLLNHFNENTKNQLYVANLIKNTYIITNIL